MFHTLIVLSLLPENSRDPSADTHTDQTEFVCPCIVFTHAPVATSHTLILLSPLPEKSRDPSADTHTDITVLACPSIVRPSSAIVSIVLSVRYGTIKYSRITFESRFQ